MDNDDGEEESLADWRKHNRLAWLDGRTLGTIKVNHSMVNLEDLDPHGMGDFNCVPVELTLEDLEVN